MMKILSFIHEKVKIALVSVRNKSFLTFLFFLMLSTAFWCFEAFNETNSVEVTVPMELENVPENVVVTTELPQNLRVTLRDRNFTLFAYRYLLSPRPVKVNFTAYANPTCYVRIPHDDVMHSVMSNFQPSTEMLTLLPDTLEYYYSYGTKKTVEPRLQGKLVAADGFYIVSKTLQPSEVTAYANEHQLDTISAAYTIPFYHSNLTENFTAPVELRNVKGVKFSPDTVQLSVEVDRLVEKTLSLPVQPLNFPEDVCLRTFPMKVNVTFQVGMKVYNDVTEKDFTLVLDANDLEDTEDKTCMVRLERQPEAVFHLRLSQQEVEYLIEKKSGQ